MADQLLTTALTWGIAGIGVLLVLGAFWLALQAYRAARAGLRRCWRYITQYPSATTGKLP